MERLGDNTTYLPSAVGLCCGTWGCKYSRKNVIFLILMTLCTLGFVVMHFPIQSKWTSIWEQCKTPHKEMTVDEVILSLLWAPSAPNITSFKNSSSARHSAVMLEQPRAQYCVGDTLNVMVDMRNYAGHPKAYGGDFIVARIHSPKLQACASGDVTDLLNGSYRVRFRLFWPGEVHVSVRLIHSAEAVSVLQRDWMQDYGKAMHMGTFISGEKKEKSQCALRLGSDRPLCEYRKKEDGEYYACYKPQTLPCNSLTLMTSTKHPAPHLTMKETQLLARKNTGIEIKNSFRPVTVIGCGADQRPTEKCVAGMNSLFPGGYFYSNRWSSSSCQAGPFLSEDAITRCLKGKTIYLLGDSTVRQWIEYLEKTLKDLRIVKGNRLHSFLAVDAHNNITVWWIKQSHPWISFASVYIKGSVTIPEVLDSIAVGSRQEDVIVVIAIGQHFRSYPPEVFIQRLRSIRRAILRLHAHSPQTTVVIKLENNRQLLENAAIFYSDWYGHMQNLAQRKVFEDLKVGLVDAWDMTVAANTFAIHPNGVIVSNEVALALSFSCH